MENKPSVPLPSTNDNICQWTIPVSDRMQIMSQLKPDDLRERKCFKKFHNKESIQVSIPSGIKGLKQRFTKATITRWSG